MGETGQDTHTRHTCNPAKPGHPRPYGRLAPEGDCRRCDELRAGAAPRSAPDWAQAASRRAESDAQRSADIRAHFAPGSPHSRGECGSVCTAFEW